MATSTADESSGPLKYQKWVLKVSIHCEGCKKKVKKVLQSIDGVYTTTVDSQQHKVTVTGDIDAETLIKKLAKTGKHAEIWPETTSPKIQNQKIENGKNNQNQKHPKSNEEGNATSDQQIQKKSTPTNDQNVDEKEKPVKTNEAVKNNGNGGKPTDGKTPTEGKKPEKKNPPASNQFPPEPVEKKGSDESEEVPAEKANGVTDGKGGKKKGNKGQNGNNNIPSKPDEVNTSVDTAVNTESAAPVTKGPQTAEINVGPPRQHVYPYGPYPSYGQATYVPAYGMSYNTAYPTLQYGASYYTPPEPYTYSRFVQSGCYESPQPSDSYKIVNVEDENMNGSGCYIM